MPWWARVLILATAFTIIAGSGMAVFVALAVNKYLKETTSPVHILSVVSSIAEVGPLPNDFRWVWALHLPVLNETASVVVAEHYPERTRFMITRLVSENRKKFPDADRFVTALSTAGFASTTMTIRDRGELPVAGQTIKFGTGEVTGSPDRMTGFIGVVYPDNSEGVIVLFGGTPGATYNLEATKEFLSNIKSF
jgi:hypothetical protein